MDNNNFTQERFEEMEAGKTVCILHEFEAPLIQFIGCLVFMRVWWSLVFKKDTNTAITLWRFPRKNLSSQLTHWELTSKLTVDSFWELSVTSQWTHKMTHIVSFPWVCNSHCELAVSYSWDHTMSSPRSGSSERTVIVANSRKAHSKLTVWAHLVSSLWANWVS